MTETTAADRLRAWVAESATASEGATPGPWRVDRDGSATVAVLAWLARYEDRGPVDLPHIAAHNPTAMAVVRADVEAVLAEVARLIRERDEARAAHDEGQRLNATLREDNERLRTALASVEARKEKP